MTSEIGPWLVRLDYKIGRWTIPNLAHQDDVAMIVTLLAPIEQELRFLEGRIYDHTYPIPGREGRYFEVVRLLSGDMQKDVQASRDAIQRHLRSLQEPWIQMLLELELHNTVRSIPHDPLSLSKYYEIEVTVSDLPNETISIPALIAACTSNY